MLKREGCDLATEQGYGNRRYSIPLGTWALGLKETGILLKVYMLHQLKGFGQTFTGEIQLLLPTLNLHWFMLFDKLLCFGIYSIPNSKVECKLVQPLWRTVWRGLKKLKIEISIDPAIPLLGI